MSSMADAAPGTDPPWVGRGKVRARARERGLDIRIEGLTTRAKYYKPLVYEFFRKEFRLQPRYGDFEIRIEMTHVGEAPRLDLDNLAKALLDALTGHVFFDDSQVALLIIERVGGERDMISLRASLR